MKTNRIPTILKWVAILLGIITFNQTVLVYKFSKIVERIDKIEASNGSIYDNRK